MPSPIGHALAGAAAAWIVDLVPGRRFWRVAPPSSSWYQRAGNGLTLVCAALAVAPDLDLVVLAFHPQVHRTATHSLGAVLVVGLSAVAAAAYAQLPIARVGLMCTAAYSTHLLLDWMAVDNVPPRGLQLFWPITLQWYISDWDLFRPTLRRHVTSGPVIRQNILAVVQEVAIMAPIAIGLWLVRVKALAGLATEVPRGDHAPK